MKELVKINAADYGLEENKAKQISDMFKPMLDKMTELEVQYNEVIKRPMEPETIQMAHDLRLAYRDVRTGTAKIHQELKKFYLQGGRFVDGWKNAQLMASQGMEEKLKAIEDHFANIEKDRISKLQEERATTLLKFEVKFIPEQLGLMEKSVWENYLSGVKLNYEAQKAAEKKAEEDCIAKEKAEAEERERIRLDNIRLKKEAEERERNEKTEAKKREKAEAIRLKKEESEQKERERIEAERLKKEAAERKIREEKERKEREAYELKLKKEREKAETERKEREKAENELRLKREAEQKAIEEEDARIQDELNRNDIAKVLSLNDDLTSLKTKYSFKSKKNQKMYSDVGILIDKIVDHVIRASDAT